MLQMFMRHNGIGSVLDLGCGDWQFSRFVDWGEVHYLGLDLVASVIEKNRRKYGNAGIQFERFSGDFADLPAADLLIAKDVLQHWSNASIKDFLPFLKNYPYALITNCVDPREQTQNKDIEDGQFRYLDISQPPFNVSCKPIYEFTNYRPKWLRFIKRIRWRKRVLLVRSKNVALASEITRPRHRTELPMNQAARVTCLQPAANIIPLR